MDLRQLEYFVEIARTLHFTRTAESLNISQPALSQQIKLLEEELGAPLFDRLGRKVSLTKFGHSFLPYAQQIIFNANQGKTAVHDTMSLKRGQINVGVANGLMSYVMAGTVSSFHKKFPAIRVSLETSRTQAIEKNILTGKYDIGLVNETDNEKDISFIPIFQEELYLVCPKGNKWIKNDSFPLELADHLPLILPPADYALRLLIEKEFRKKGLNPKIILEVSDFETIRLLVKSGVGCSFLPDRYLSLFPNDQLIGVPIPQLNLKRSVGLIYHKEKYVCSAITELLTFLRQFVFPESQAATNF